MKKVLLLLIAILLIYPQAYSQKSFTVICSPRKYKIPEPYFLVSAKDIRPDPNYDGRADIGLNNKTVPVQLEHGAANFLSKKLSPQRPDKTHDVALNIEILKVEFSESRNTYAETGTCTLALRFSGKYADSSGFSYITWCRSQAETRGDVSDTHVVLVARSLSQCLKDLRAKTDSALKRVPVAEEVKPAYPGITSMLVITGNRLAYYNTDGDLIEQLKLEPGLKLITESGNTGLFTYGYKTISPFMALHLLSSRQDEELKEQTDMVYMALGKYIKNAALANGLGGIIGGAVFSAASTNPLQAQSPEISAAADIFNRKVSESGFLPAIGFTNSEIHK
ncbi:MAG: hypothetical protein V4543_09970 [Bacteroidota bacterium]